MNRGDIGMIQCGQHLRFALKARKSICIVRERFWENFDRYITPEFCVMGLVDFTHAARTNLGDDLVRAELSSSFDAHYFPGGTRRFSSSNQLSTTLICVADELCSFSLIIRKC